MPHDATSSVNFALNTSASSRLIGPKSCAVLKLKTRLSTPSGFELLQIWRTTSSNPPWVSGK